MTEIDSLDIKISAEAKKANDAIDSIIKNLSRLTDSLKIDTKGLEKIGQSLSFGKAAKNMQSEISNVAKSVDNQMQKITKSASEAAKEFQNKFKDIPVKIDFSKSESELRKFQTQAKNAENALTRIMASSNADKQIKSIEKWSISLAQANNAITQIKSHLSEIQTTQAPQIDFRPTETQNAVKYIIEYKKELIDFKNEMKSISEGFGGYLNAPKGTFDVPMENLKISIQELKKDYPQATEIITAFEKELQRLQEISSKLTREPTRIRIDTSQLNAVNEKIAELKQRFDKAGMDFKFTGNFEQLKVEIQKAYSKLDELLAKEREMISAGKIDTSGFEKLQESIARTGNKIPILEELRDRSEAFNRTMQQLAIPPIREENLTKLQNALRKTEEQTERLKIKLENAITKGEIVPNVDDSKFRKLTEQIILSEKQAEALRQKIEEIGNSTGGASSKLSIFKDTISKIFNSLTKTSSSTKALNGNMKKLSSIMGSFNSSAGKAVTNLKSFTRQALSAMGVYLGIYGAVRGLKNALKSSMGYIEDLNYFNAAFGQVAQKADLSSWKEMGYKTADEYYNSFVKRAEQITQKLSGFKVSDTGMLENTGMKNLGLNPSQLMNYQAMFSQMSSSMGMVSENALMLSEVMTKLGADLASVKNMDFSKTWQDMASSMVGMSRTADKYGANLRNVNLQQKLNELGIKANISALNQNDKAMLRTIIMLESTEYAWGDMARTIERPANQLKLIKANFSNLARTIGNIFLPIIAKVLPYINALLIALQRLAEGIVKMLGFKDFDWGGLGGGKDNDVLSNIYDDADNAADSLKNITDNAKELKNELMGFDKINKLSDTTDTDKTDNKNGLSTEDSAALSAAFNKIASDYLAVWQKAFDGVNSKAQETADKIIKAFKSGDFKGIGSYIGNQLTNQLKKIPWKTKIYPAAEKFGSGLADFLNGLISPELFGEVGKTIASSLNTALHFLDSFGKTFDWTNFGDSIAAGVNNFFETFDFALLADTINAWANGILDTIIAFIDKTDWEMIGQQIGVFLAELDFVEIGKKIGTALWKAINAGIDLFKGMFDKAPIETTLLGFAVGAIAITKLSAAFSGLISVISSFASAIAPITAVFAEGGLFGAGGAIATASAPVLALTAAIAALIAGLGYVFATNEEIRESFFESTAIISDNLKPAIEFLSKKVFPDLKKAWKEITIILKPFTKFLKNTFTSVWEDMINPALKQIGETVVPTLVETFKNLWNNVLVPLGKFIGSVLKPIFEKISQVLEVLWKNVIVPSAQATGGIFLEAWKTFFDVLNQKIIPNIKSLITTMQFLWNKVFKPFLDFLTGVFLVKFKLVFNSIKSVIKGIAQVFKGIIKTIRGLATGDWKTAWQGIKDVFKGIAKTITNLIKGLKDAFLSVITSISTIANNAWKKTWEIVKIVFSTAFKPIKDLIKKLKTTFMSLITSIDTIANNSWKKTWETVKSVFSEIFKPIKKAIKGLKDTFSSVITSIDTITGDKWRILWEKVQSVFSTAFKPVKEFISGIKTAFNDVISAIKAAADGDWKTAWQKVKDAFTGIWDSLSNVLKVPLNLALGMFETFANGIIDAWNWIKKSINSINIEIPDWIPELGGKKFGFDLEKTEHITIKKFAQGGFPEDGWFRASKGEYFGQFDDGTSYIANNEQIEGGIASAVAPAVYNAVLSAMQNSQGNINVNVILEGDAKGVFSLVKKEADTRTLLTGQPAFNL